VSYSSYAGCYHDEESPISTDNHGVFFLNSRVRLEEVTDGLGQTIFVGEVATPHPLGWFSGTRATLRNTGHPINHPDRSRLGAAAPAPVDPDADSPAEELEDQIEAGQIFVGPLFVGGFSSHHLPDGGNFAFGDGSVRFVRAAVDPSVYRRLGHRSDGELLDDEAY
jgi:prepilin-type processing-associated H-X9-DG protein